MKKSLILLSTLSLFANSCVKENNIQKNNPKDQFESNVISGTTLTFVDLSQNNDFINLVNFQSELLNLMISSDITNENNILLINDLHNISNETNESQFIELLDSYGINGNEFNRIANLQIQSMQNILSQYPEFSNLELFKESINNSLFNVSFNNQVVANNLCLKIYNLSVQSCNIEFQKATMFAVAEGIIVAGFSGFGGVLVAGAHIASAALSYKNCMGLADLNYANCE